MKVRNRFAFALLSSALCLSSPQLVRAQNQYEQLPAVAAPKNFPDVAKEPGPLSQASKDVVKLTVDSFLSQMTDPRVSPDKKRNELETNFMRQIVSEDGLAVASKEAMDVANKILRGPFAPAVKINAMILLSELLEGPGNERIPFGAATRELYLYATTDSIPCYLRSLALVGLERHVQAGKVLNDPKAVGGRDSVTSGLVKIIGSQPQRASEEEAHWWMVRRAYDVLITMHMANARAKEPQLSAGMISAVVQAMDQFTDPNQLTSIRYAAGKFLTRFDFAATKPAFRMKLFLGVAQFLDQEVVGWYENESDKTKMLTGGGGMGSMGGYGGGMMGGGDGAGMMMGDASGYGGNGGEGGMGGMPGMPGGGRGGNQGPKPIDSQPWDLRIERRKLNMYTQLAHALLKGNLTKEERDYHPTGKGVMEVALPESHQRAGKFLIESLEEVQEIINERNLTTVSTLMTRLVNPLTKMRDAVELVPAFSEGDKELVKSFKDFSPRMKSFKKADASGKLESATKPPAAAGEPAGGDAGAAPPADGAAPAAATPAPAAAAPAAAPPAAAAPNPAVNLNQQ